MTLLIGGTGAAKRQPDAGQQQRSDVDLTFRQQSNLSPQEMIDQAEATLKDIQAGLKRIVGLQELARKSNDIIKLNCVNDKLVQVKAAANIAEQSMTDLHEGIARRDEGMRIHAFTKQSITMQKVRVLVTEAENCVGQDISFVGSEQVTVDVDPSIPEADPTEPNLPVLRDDVPPTAISPSA
jgi:hypothetical protein